MCKNAHLRITVVAHTTLHVLCSESKSKYWINSYLKRFLISRVIRLKWKLLPNSLLCRRIKEILFWPLYGQHFLKISKCWAIWVWPYQFWNFWKPQNQSKGLKLNNGPILRYAQVFKAFISYWRICHLAAIFMNYEILAFDVSIMLPSINQTSCHIASDFMIESTLKMDFKCILTPKRDGI